MAANRIAIIPAYEPDRRMLELAEKVRDNGFLLLLVDDGSGPKYADLFRQAASFGSVISYPENHGKGYALKTALAWLLEHRKEDCQIITLDSDGQHSMKDALRLIEELQKAPEALWLGSRFLPKDAPFRSRLGNGINRFLFRKCTHTDVYDVQTGMRAFSSALIPMMLQSAGNRYEYEMNVLLDAVEKKIPIREIEIETIYIDNNSGSHFRTFRDSFRIYRQIFRAFGRFKR